MKKEIDAYEKNLIGNFIKILIYTLRWLCLALGVINAGLLIGLAVILLVYGSDVSNEIVAKMMELLTYKTAEDALELIAVQGMVKTIVASFAYGLALTLNYAIEYLLLNNFTKLLKSIIDGNMFTKENIKMIYDSLPLSVILAFAQPVIIFVTIYSTNIFDYADINVSGIVFICVIYILKLIFEKGYELSIMNEKYNRQLSDMKVRESELKIEAIKKEAEIKESEQPKKKTAPKKRRYPKKTTNK